MTELAPIVISEEAARAILDQLAGPTATRVALSGELCAATNAYADAMADDINRDPSAPWATRAVSKATMRAYLRFLDALQAVAVRRAVDRRVAETAEGQS